MLNTKSFKNVSNRIFYPSLSLTAHLELFYGKFLLPMSYLVLLTLKSHLHLRGTHSHDIATTNTKPYPKIALSWAMISLPAVDKKGISQIYNDE